MRQITLYEVVSLGSFNIKCTRRGVNEKVHCASDVVSNLYVSRHSGATAAQAAPESMPQSLSLLFPTSVDTSLSSRRERTLN